MPQLDELLKQDYDVSRKRLARLNKQRQRLRWKLQYIETLLKTNSAPPKPAGPPTQPPPEPKPFTGLTIADTAARVLAAAGQPLSAMEIAKRAMAGGFTADNVERARSHFSATISKDINSGKPRFWQADRGAIGLAEWRDRPPATSPPPVVQDGFKDDPPPFGDEQHFKDDDIPF